jgi:uncharacterized membrane protein
MRFLVRYFLRGLLVVVPAALTVWIVLVVFVFVDDLLPLTESESWMEEFFGLQIPGDKLAARGVGFALTLVLITVVGVLTSNILTRWIFARLERVFVRVPIVKTLYISIKDVIEAFVSEEKKFDQPVMLSFADEVAVLGFVTRESLTEFGIEDRVAVYVPQSYNFAANLVLVPRDRVSPIDLPAADVMAFIVSGGVSKITQREAAKKG